jgi:hypothetical protein
VENPQGRHMKLTTVNNTSDLIIMSADAASSEIQINVKGIII